MTRPLTTLLVCTLNEVHGMRAIMPQLSPDCVDQILVLDGGSTDGTLECAREQGYEVYVQKERGLRHAYVEVLPLVRGDVIVTFSPDGNSLPEAVPRLVEKMAEGYDMVIASRYLPPARSHDDTLVTAFGNWLFTRSINLVHGGHYTDAMVMLRAYRKSVIERLGLDRDDAYRFVERLFRTRISWEPLLSIRAARCGLRTTEIAADEPPRVGGERKLEVLRWGAAYGWQVLFDRYRLPQASHGDQDGAPRR